MKSIKSHFFLAFLFFIHSSVAQVSPIAANSLELNGNNFVSVPDHNLLDLNTNTTFEGWYNFCSSGMIFSKNFCLNEAGYYLTVEPAGNLRLRALNDVVCTSGPNISSATTSSYSFNEWHHFALTVSVSAGNTQFRLFMDHNPAAVLTQNVSWVTNNNTEPLRIGTYRGITGSMGLFPQGRIQDFRVYNSIVPFSSQCLATPASSPFLRLEMQNGGTPVLTNTGSLLSTLNGSNLNSSSNTTNPNYLSSTPSLSEANLSHSFTNNSCNNQITLATDPFAFSYTWFVQTPGSSSWSLISNTTDTSSTYSASGNGNYSFIVSGTIGSCINSDTIAVINTPWNINTLVQNESCLNLCDGAISCTVTGTSNPLTYLWSNGQTSPNISNLCPGNYTVQVTDQNGCTGSAQAIVSSGASVSVSATQVNETCQNACNGSITTSVSGGTAPYTYSWSNGTSTSNISNLCPAVYTVQITDQNGCTGNTQAIVSGGATISVVASAVDESCENSCNASANLSISNGNAPYSILWSNGETTSSISNLCPAIYTAQVTDQSGCTASVQVNIAAGIGSLFIQLTPANESCQGVCDGSIAASPMGTGPYTYLWDNGSTSSSISNLCPGNYGLVVTDQTGCIGTASESIIVGSLPPNAAIQTTGPFSIIDAPIQFTATPAGGIWSSNCGTCISASGVFNPQNAGEGTFQICYTVSTGACSDQDCQTIIVTGCPQQVTSESYSMCPGETYTFNGQNLTNEGIYPVVFTGQNGCDSIHTLTLSIFTVKPTYQTFTPCKGDSVLIQGIWYFESDNVVISDTTLNGCTTTHTTQILFEDCSIEDYAVFIPNTFTPNDDNTNDFFSISIMGGYLVEGFIVNRWGNIIKEFHDGDLKWDGRTKEGLIVPDGVYTYVFIVADNNSRKTRYNGFVTKIR